MSEAASEVVLVCGGRDYADRARFWSVMDIYAGDAVVIVHGMCPTGADDLAEVWALDTGKTVKRYPADWKQHGRAAGPIRNQRMIDEGRPTKGIAFPGGRGTADMVRRLRIAGIQVVEVPA